MQGQQAAADMMMRMPDPCCGCSLSLSQYFQEVRDYVSSLCGCLREKETMIKELDNAMAAIRREACDTAWSRRVEAQVRHAGSTFTPLFHPWVTSLAGRGSSLILWWWTGGLPDASRRTSCRP